MAHTVRAILLASAIAASFLGLRASKLSMCGRPPGCKDFVQLTGRVWSIAVMCPACVCGRGPLAQMGCADRVLNINAMSQHQRVPRGVPILGSTDRHLAAVLASARACPGEGRGQGGVVSEPQAALGCR